MCLAEFFPSGEKKEEGKNVAKKGEKKEHGLKRKKLILKKKRKRKAKGRRLNALSEENNS